MRSDAARIGDILTAVDAAMRAAGPRSRLDVDEETLVAALTFQLIVIGEAAAAISQQGRDRWPDLPWREMIGMRNLVVHAYWSVDRDRVWRTVESDLPPLAERLRQILHVEGD